MAECNYCTLLGIKARHRDKRVVVRDNEWAGIDIFVGPRELSEDAIGAARDKYFVARFMELPEGCAC